MKKNLSLLYIPIIIGLLSSCSNINAEKKPSPQTQQARASLGVTDSMLKEKALNYPEIVLRETSIDSFSLPFPEQEMLTELRDFHHPYSVERKIGQQDGPDFEYIEISRNKTPVVYFMFDWENKYRLEKIMVHNSTVVDEYGVRVGDTYSALKKKRKESFKNSTNYHEHTYLYTGNSNIHYEMTTKSFNYHEFGNIEELELTEKQLEDWTVKKIIWRKNN